MLIPVFQFISPLFPPPVAISLFSTYVTIHKTRLLKTAASGTSKKNESQPPTSPVTGDLPRQDPSLTDCLSNLVPRLCNALRA